MHNIEYLEKIVDGMTRVTIEIIQKFEEEYHQETKSLITTIESDLTKYSSTGILLFNHNGSEKNSTPNRRGRSSRRTDASIHSNSLKENQQENADPPVRNNNKRPLTETRQLLHDNIPKKSSFQLTVKLERLEEEFSSSSPEITNVAIKQEKIDMPPPSKPPVRQTRKRKGVQNADDTVNMESVRVKEEKIESEVKKRKATRKLTADEKDTATVRDSDIIVTSKAIDTISLIDTEEDFELTKLKNTGKSKKNTTDSSLNSQESDSETIQTTRVTRTKTRNAAKKKENQNEKQLLESSDDANLNSQNKEIEANQTIRVTRTKTRNAKNAENETTDANKRLCESSEDDTHNKTKRTKQRNKEEYKETNSSEYEDAVSDTNSTNKNRSYPKASKGKETQGETNKNKKKETGKENTNDKNITTVLNQTTVLSKPTILNETIVKEHLPNEQLVNNTVILNKMPNGVPPVDDLMTDDEDIVTSPVAPPRSKRQMFSPSASSPVKKRVEAFEKLKAGGANGIPTRTLNSKIKGREEKKQENDRTSATKYGAIPKLLRTPTAQQKIVSTQCLSADKYMVKTRRDLSTDNTAVGIKSHTALKVSQAEFRERELRRRQKEAEALIKKEALMQASIQEKRKKREDRQVKAQQARDAKEKDKQKMLEEAERLKQEKYKQAVAEKEEKLSRQREEAEKKRLLAMKKAAEEKRKDERKALPPYLKHEAPLLPTFDCYDSDDSTNNPKDSAPLWQRKEVLYKTLAFIRYVGIYKSRLFGTRPETVDLQQIFPSIDPSKLKRTSSAIWNKSQLAALIEEDDNS